MVAAFAAARHDGSVRRGTLGPLHRDNYIAEMVAQIMAAGGDEERLVIVYDATSPVQALVRFMVSCARRQQRVYRRDLLQVWLTRLRRKKAIAWLHQPSHVGEPTNEWADVEADGSVLEPLLEPLLVQLGAEEPTYCSLEVLGGRFGEEEPSSDITQGSIRDWMSQRLQRVVEAKLRTTANTLQMWEEGDLLLGKLPRVLEELAEDVRAGRAQLGDPRRHLGRLAQRLVKQEGCPFGCGCHFSTMDVAFRCQGQPIVQARGEWRAAVMDAKWELEKNKTHQGWSELLARLKVSSGALPARYCKNLDYGSTAEVRMRRLIGALVAGTGSREVDGKRQCLQAVGTAAKAGLRLQEVAKKEAAAVERRVRDEVRRIGRARKWACEWLAAVVRGGPRKAAMLRWADSELRAAACRGLLVWLDSGLNDRLLRERWAAVEGVAAERRAEARDGGGGPNRGPSRSAAMAVREWRWAAMLRWWRWRAVIGRVETVEDEGEGEGQEEAEARLAAEERARLIADRRSCEALVCLRMGWRAAAAGEEEEAAGAVRHVGRARRWLQAAGGRQRLAYLSRFEVHSGYECSVCKRGFGCALAGGLCGGKWAVEKLLDVRRPEQRRGTQLEVQVQWRGADPWDRPWPIEWQPLRWLTHDLKLEARRMERRRWPSGWASRPEGSRHCSRLAARSAAEGPRADDARETEDPLSRESRRRWRREEEARRLKALPVEDRARASRSVGLVTWRELSWSERRQMVFDLAGGEEGMDEARQEMARWRAPAATVTLPVLEGYLVGNDGVVVRPEAGGAGGGDTGGEGGSDSSRSAEAGNGGGLCIECEEEDAAGGFVLDEEDAALLQRKRRKLKEDEEMRRRVGVLVEVQMDNGVRIDPRLRAIARAGEGRLHAAAIEEEAADGAKAARRQRCPAGHELLPCQGGSEGLRCDGGCGRALRRSARRWSCEKCDHDVCDACAGQGQDGGPGR